MKVKASIFVIEMTRYLFLKIQFWCDFLNMISLEKCKEILNCDGQNYSIEEIKMIRHSLESLASVFYELTQKEYE